MMETPAILPNVYILSGDDMVGKDRFRIDTTNKIRDIHKHCLIERFDHADGDFNDFIQSMLTQSLFQETRIFIISHTEQLSEHELKQLNKILKQPPTDAYLFILICEVKKRKETGAQAVKILQAEKRSKQSPDIYVLRDFPSPADYKVGQWLVSQLPVLFNRTISKSDADFFIDLAGNNIDLLHSELQKIDIHLEPGVAVTRDVIEQIVGPSRQMTVFELSTALAGNNFSRALTIIDSLFSVTFGAPAMVSALFRHFWALLRIRQFARVNPDVIRTFTKSKGFSNPAQNESALAIGQAAGLLGPSDMRKVYPVIIASGIVGQAQRFTDEGLKLIIRWLLEFDVGVKTGRIVVTQHEVQLLCYRIARVEELIKSGIAA